MIRWLFGVEVTARSSPSKLIPLFILLRIYIISIFSTSLYKQDLAQFN